MHKLLERQLTRLHIPTDGTPPPAQEWTKLLERIERAYSDADQDRYTLERSIAISSAEMLLLHEHLRAERDKLRTIFESAALGILSIDARGRILDANPAASTMLGLTRDELIAKQFRPLFTDSKDTAVSSAPPPSRDDARVDERRYAHPNGGTSWFNTTKTWVHDATGAVQLGTVIMEDVTQRKHLECSLRHAQKLESVGRLASGIAHEINTPIQFINDNVHFLGDAFAAVMTMVDTLRAEMAAQGEAMLARCREAEAATDWQYLGEEVPTSIAQTIEGLQRVATIVHSMKSFAHNEHGEQVPTDLNAALASTLVVAGHELKGVAVTVQDFGELPLVTCCRGDLNQVFLNLIVNAAHAIRDVSAKTGELGRITVKSRVDGECVAISITDTGGGIPDDVAARVFDPFFTTKEVGRGSGQGLALARGIVINQHAGTISFETSVGIGTTFTVRLPIDGARSAQVKAA